MPDLARSTLFVLPLRGGAVSDTFTAANPNYHHMNCPKCNHGTVFVLQSNTTKPNHTTRQRVCNDCKHKWFTVELEIESWAVKWEKVNPDFRFGGKPTPYVPVSIVYGEDND